MTEGDHNPDMDLLAQALAVNHLNLSVVAPGGDESRFKDAARIALDDPNSHRGRSRTIVIVGAGASRGAFGPQLYPSALEAISRIRDELFAGEAQLAKKGALDETAEVVGRWIDARVSRYPAMYGFKKPDFEIHLAVLSEIFGQEKVRAALKRIFGRPEAPHIAFEVLAHLLKHRFIDAIINFNFDELLDVAVRQEMGSTEFIYAYSDGHCRDLDELVVDGRLKKPLYIKPHGTISHPSSLRFTKEHYFELPPAMRTFLDDIVTGRRRSHEPVKADDPSPYKDKQFYTDSVTLITIGFGMNSLDLQAILESDAFKGKPERLKLFHVNPEGLEESKRFPCSHPVWIKVDSAGDQLPDVMERLWKRVSSQFKPNLRPRGIRRHLIVDRLFCRRSSGATYGTRVPALPTPEEGPDTAYLYARLCVELAIELARGNGQVSLDDLSGTRVGDYAKQLTVAMRRASHGLGTPSTSPTISADPTVLEPSFAKACHDLGLVAKRYNGRMLALADLPSSETASTAQAVDLVIAQKLWSLLRPILTHLPSPDDDLDKEMVGYLKSLCSSDAVTIEPHFDAGHLLLARAPTADRILHTSLALGLQFIDVLRRDWDVLLVVSTFGKFLEKYKLHYLEYEADRRARLPSLSSRLVSVVTSEALNAHAVLQRFRSFAKDDQVAFLGPVDVDPKAQPFYHRPFWASRRNFVLALKLNDATGE